MRRPTALQRLLKDAGFIALALSAVGAASDAHAQGAYPVKPIRVIITLTPGSANDIIPRLVLEQVAQSIGQPFVFENRPGAAGTIAANAVAKADPDGYTLLGLSTTHAMAPGVIKNVPYDSAADFAGITTLGALPHVLVISTEQKITTIQQLVAAAKQRPGGITYGAILGAGPHFNAFHFTQTMKIDGRLVPFKGAPEALTEVLAGRVDIYFSPITPALPFLQGKMHPIAVTSQKRSSALPDTPTTFEQGYPNSEFGLWVGLAAPAKSPRAAITTLHAEIGKALKVPSVIERLGKMGVEPMLLEPEAFDGLIRKELATYTDLARKAGMVQQ